MEVKVEKCNTCKINIYSHAYIHTSTRIHTWYIHTIPVAADCRCVAHFSNKNIPRDDGTCFWMSYDARDWHRAQQKCHDLGGTLATIKSPQMLSLIRSSGLSENSG